MGESFEERQARWQEITNERPIPPRRLQHNCNVPVRARIVWERDGEEFRDTIAYAWGPHSVVLVEVLDDRRDTIGVWLHVSDAPRR